MFEKQNYSAIPNELLDEHMRDISGSEFKLALIVSRQTVGWHKPNDWITTAQFMAKTGLSNRCVIDGLRSLVTKKIIVVTFICEKCKTPLEKIEIPFECPICSSKEHPTKYYQLNVNYEGNEAKNIPEEKQKPPNPGQKATEKEGQRSNFIAESSQPTALKVHDPVNLVHSPPVNLVHSPCELSSQPTDLKPLSDNDSQAPKETLQKKSKKEISQSEKLTKKYPEAVSENFEFWEGRDDFSEKAEPEEEKREEIDFRSIKEPEPNQAETEGTEGVNKFTAGILAEIGNESSFAEEKKTGREDQSSEKEIRELLNSYMSNGWNLQISNNDDEHIKEIMKFPYKDVKASCEDRLTNNRPAIPKLYPKWVLDGLRLGIKAKKLTQLEREALLEDELVEYYQNGNGDKALCRDVLKKLYSVIQSPGIILNRYDVAVNWCGYRWQDETTE